MNLLRDDDNEDDDDDDEDRDRERHIGKGREGWEREEGRSRQNGIWNTKENPRNSLHLDRE